MTADADTMSEEPEYVSLDEASRLLGVTRKSLGTRICHGDLVGVRIDGRWRYAGITVASLESYRKRQEVHRAHRANGIRKRQEAAERRKRSRWCPVCGWKTETPGEPCHLCRMLEGKKYYWLREACGV